MPGYLTVLDERMRELVQDNPGWQIWYVPHTVDKSVTWCARPWPLLNADNPEELQKRFDEARDKPDDR